MAVCFSLVAAISGLCSVFFSGVTANWLMNKEDKSATRPMFLGTITMWILTAIIVLIAKSYMI